MTRTRPLTQRSLQRMRSPSLAIHEIPTGLTAAVRRLTPSPMHATSASLEIVRQADHQPSEPYESTRDDSRTRPMHVSNPFRARRSNLSRAIPNKFGLVRRVRPAIQNTHAIRVHVLVQHLRNSSPPTPWYRSLTSSKVPVSPFVCHPNKLLGCERSEPDQRQLVSGHPPGID